MKFIHLTNNNLFLLEIFLSNLGETGRKSFRYFDKRSIKIVLNHELAALLLTPDEIPVAYGHLDKEGEILWLGIAVVEGERGKGFGQQMMHYLINCAKIKGFNKIDLTVDLDNKEAINLYKKVGFKKVKIKNHYMRFSLTF